jgi:NAD(P)-dependent dehydrogenase (short-subunit alcohol dehydrogenase family)
MLGRMSAASPVIVCIDGPAWAGPSRLCQDRRDFDATEGEGAMPIDKSKPVLITGCSTGIGRATAERLASDGWNVYATARKPESIEGLKSSGAKTLALDVNDESSMAGAVTEVEKDGGSIGALVNNAGYSQSGAIESIPMDSVRKQFDTNVFGLMRMCQLVLPGMRGAHSGRIVNVSSMGGKLVFPGGGVYHGTKHAVEAISDALRFEVSGFGIDVVIIEPGLIKTEFGETAAGSISEAEAGGPYGKFNAEVAKATSEAYEGPLAKLGGGPETVAAKIEKALTARRPHTRYKVTASAGMIMGMRGAMTDRMWDRFTGSQFPKPKPDG